MVEVRIDVHELDAEFPGPRAPLHPLEPVGRVRIAGPEHDHLGFLETVLHGAVELRAPEAQAVAPVVHRAPEPAFPAVGAVHELGDADQVPEAVEGAQVVAEVAPLVVRAVRDRDGARAHGLGALDLLADDVERFVPADAHEPGLAAILDVAVAVRIEVDPLHRVEQAVLRIQHRLLAHAVRAQRRSPRWRERPAARRDGPGRRVLGVEVDRGGAQDLAVLHVDEDRAAVGAARIPHDTVAHISSGLPGDGFQPAKGGHEPDSEVIGAVQADLEILRGVDALQQVERRRQEALRDRLVLEVEGKVGPRVDALARADPAVVELDPAALGPVPQPELRDEVSLLQAGGVLRVKARSRSHRLRDAPQQHG